MTVSPRDASGLSMVTFHAAICDMHVISAGHRAVLEYRMPNCTRDRYCCTWSGRSNQRVVCEWAVAELDTATSNTKCILPDGSTASA
eukprot:1606526-Rhodomonas_salina.1